MGISSSNQRKDEEGFYSLTNENNLKRKDSNFKHRARLFKILNRDLTIEEINNLRDKKDLFKFEYKTLGIYEKNFLHYITQNSNERVLRNFCHVFPAIAKYLSCQTENRSYPYQSLFINEYPNVLYEANIYLEYDLKIDILEPHYSKFNHLIEKKSFLDELNIYYNHSDHLNYEEFFKFFALVIIKKDKLEPKITDENILAALNECDISKASNEINDFGTSDYKIINKFLNKNMSKIIDLDYNYEGIKALPYILCKQQGIETWPNEDRLMLLKSVMGKKTYALNKLLNHNFDFGLHENGYNILSIAVQYGTLRDVVTIANKNPELVNKPDNQNKTPLDYTKTADKQYALIKEGALLYNVKDKNLRNYQANIINDLKGLRLSNDLNEMKEQIKIILSNITFLFDKNGASLLSNKVDLVKLNEIFQNICSICSDLALTNNKKCFNIHDFFKKIDFGKIDDVCLKLEEPIKDFLSAIATMHNLLSNPLDKIDLPQSKQVRFAAQRVD